MLNGCLRHAYSLILYYTERNWSGEQIFLVCPTGTRAQDKCCLTNSTRETSSVISSKSKEMIYLADETVVTCCTRQYDRPRVSCNPCFLHNSNSRTLRFDWDHLHLFGLASSCPLKSQDSSKKNERRKSRMSWWFAFNLSIGVCVCLPDTQYVLLVTNSGLTYFLF
jgi:hypothetical protein